MPTRPLPPEPSPSSLTPGHIQELKLSRRAVPPPERREFGGRVFVVYNTARWLYRFRLPLMRTLQARGHEVHGVSPPDAYATALEEAGVPHIPIRLSRKGTNPVDDARLLARLHRLFRKRRPDVVLTYTVKPNIYGSLAARSLGIPVINTISGLGSLFVRPTLMTVFVQRLYGLAFRSSHRVFFQNRDDLKRFVDDGVVRSALAERIPGTGIDTAFFAPEPAATPQSEKAPQNGDAPQTAERDRGDFVFLFAGRLLWEKGIGELVHATRILKARGVKVECRLLGPFEPPGRGAVSPAQVGQWTEEGVVDHLGDVEEVVEYMRDADCVVLPSYYREGMPRTLIEAASLGKPIITADVAGSRDVVDHGRNGLLCRPRDAADLADKMHAMVRFPSDERARMGTEGRARACHEFDQRLVIQRYVAAVEEALEETMVEARSRA